jgi:hypothetical protein
VVRVFPVLGNSEAAMLTGVAAYYVRFSESASLFLKARQFFFKLPGFRS